MTTITVPRETWDAMREALKHGIREMNLSGKAKECMPLHHALTAANAVSEQQGEAKTYAPSRQRVVMACDILDRIKEAHENWGGWSGTPSSCDAAINLLRYPANMPVNAAHPQATEPQAQGEAQTLLPCPFCGSHLVSVSEGVNGDGKPWPYVECEECAACAEPDMWNKRTHPQATEPAWRPIESAPKDGTWVLAINAKTNPTRQHVVRYFDDAGIYPWKTGSGHMDWVAGLTHWLPLPAAPEAKQ